METKHKEDCNSLYHNPSGVAPGELPCTCTPEPREEWNWEKRFDQYFYDSSHSLTENQVAHIKKNLVRKKKNNINQFRWGVRNLLNNVLPH
jgi:hypothetical protein